MCKNEREVVITRKLRRLVDANMSTDEFEENRGYKLEGKYPHHIVRLPNGGRFYADGGYVNVPAGTYKMVSGGSPVSSERWEKIE